MQCFYTFICSTVFFFVLLLVSYSNLIADCLLVFSEFFIFLFRLVLFFCDIDMGNKNYEISMVSKMLIT